MRLPAILANRLRLPVVGSPLLTISNRELVIAQCKAGIVGAFPTLNARDTEELDMSLTQIEDALTEHDRRHPSRPSAPFAVNQIVHRSNARLYHDMETVVRHRVPIVLTSVDASLEINEMVHAYGGIVFHYVVNNHFALKAIENGADGVIAVAAGAGGHAGTQSPFALVQEIRRWFDGPLLLSGSIASGRSIFGATAMGADLACVGSAFIATKEAKAEAPYRRMAERSSATDIEYTGLDTGTSGYYSRPSGGETRMDLHNSISTMNFGIDTPGPMDILGSGLDIVDLKDVPTASELVDRLAADYETARNEFLWQMEDTVEPRWAPSAVFPEGR